MAPDLLSYSRKLFAEVISIKSGRSVPTSHQGSIRRLSDLEIVLFKPLHQDVEISVLIPTFNRPFLVHRAVQSAAALDGENCELILINDGGVPVTAQTLECLSSVRMPVTVINHRTNRGLGAARNSAAYFSRGKWLLMLDDDDEILPEGLVKLLGLSRQSGSGFIHGDHIRRYFTNDGIHEEYVTRGSNVFTLLEYENWIPTGSFMIRRDLFFQLNGYREDFVVHEDYNLHIRASTETTFKYMPTPVFVYNCRTDITRLNLSKRLFWFSTSMLNHILYNFFNERNKELAARQKIGEYEHIERALKEGSSPDEVIAVISAWWEASAENKLPSASSELPITKQLCPSIWPQLDSIARALEVSRFTNFKV